MPSPGQIHLVLLKRKEGGKERKKEDKKKKERRLNPIESSWKNISRAVISLKKKQIPQMFLFDILHINSPLFMYKTGT